MKNLMNFPFAMLLLLSSIVFNALHAQVRISLNDFQILNNTSWEGTLTYLDYQSNELVPIAATMQMAVAGNLIEQNVQYTWEPHKNILAKTKIRRKGRFLGKQKVIAKSLKEGGSVLLTTTYKGKDEKEKATMYVTYEFNDKLYKVTKEVQLKGSNERFMRNNYSYRRIK